MVAGWFGLEIGRLYMCVSELVVSEWAPLPMGRAAREREERETGVTVAWRFLSRRSLRYVRGMVGRGMMDGMDGGMDSGMDGGVCSEVGG